MRVLKGQGGLNESWTQSRITKKNEKILNAQWVSFNGEPPIRLKSSTFIILKASINNPEATQGNLPPSDPTQGNLPKRTSTREPPPKKPLQATPLEISPPPHVAPKSDRSGFYRTSLAICFNAVASAALDAIRGFIQFVFFCCEGCTNPVSLNCASINLAVYWRCRSFLLAAAVSHPFMHFNYCKSNFRVS